MFKPKARIVDMDGTACDVSSIRHFVQRVKGEKDFAAFHAASEFCPSIPMAIEYMRETVRLGMTNLVVTARMEMWKGVTERFLAREAVFEDGTPIPYDGPFMRADGDFKPDRLIKSQILRYLKRHYDIRGAIDDNPAVVALWTAHGIPTVVVPGWDDEAAAEYVAKSKEVLDK
jgi:hypothetical protein